jgi:Fur family ferric uptake transcriptional regulator
LKNLTKAFEKTCEEKGIRLTGHRRVIAKVLEESDDHPDIHLVHERATTYEPTISMATVYRTLRLFEEMNLLNKHEFKLGPSRYEIASEDHHDHLIDIENHKILEFKNAAIEVLQQKIASELGYELIDHRLELYCIPRKKKK